MITPDDPVIKIIRDVRHEISETNDHDPKKLIQYYLELQEKYNLKSKMQIEQSANDSNI